MRVAALIPARKNSRRIPDKNRCEVGGVPLWRHAVQHAIDSGVIDAILISSDDPAILADAAMFGVRSEVRIWSCHQPQFKQTYDVMRHVVLHGDKELQENFNFDATAICLLQPTSPLRTGDDIARCVGKLTEGVDSVVSVAEGPDDIAFQIRHAGRLEQIPPIVVPNGAIYLIKTSVLRAGGHWYGPYAYAYQMPKERSIDIDNEIDLEMAQTAWDSLYGRSR